MSRLMSGVRRSCSARRARVVLLAQPSQAQTGAVSGRVVDGADKPLEKAVVVIEFTDGINRRYEVKTNKKGEFIQIGLAPGNYKITAKYENLGEQSQTVRVRLGDPTKVDIVLGGGPGGMTKEDAAKAAAVKALFDEGVALSKEHKYDEAIAKFTEASDVTPGCFDCYYNIGFAHSQKKEYDQAEAAFLKAIELRPNHVDVQRPGDGTTRRRSSTRRRRRARRSPAGCVAGLAPRARAPLEAEHNQGVILWNRRQDRRGREHFQQVILLKPDHADAHYQLGMAYVNQNKLAEAFRCSRELLNLRPTGSSRRRPGVLASIKK